mgnify:CR=1 FL=1
MRAILRADRIIDVALASGAQAIHPGYGFLSENADFAHACAQAAIVFIGPPAGAIRAMGSKSAAKDIMAKAGVPLVPGYHGDAQDPDTLAREADADRLSACSSRPLRAAAARACAVVESAAQLRGCAGRREARAAASSFGDDRLLIEKYLTRPRHIEMQVFADSHGNCDLSVRARLLGAAPSSEGSGGSAGAGHDAPQRRARWAQPRWPRPRAVGYVERRHGRVHRRRGPARFYFMEMNTRLQVEHPVTEMITGLDLVEWQLRGRCGRAAAARRRSSWRSRGHAIEARIYAEDPARGFLPAAGRIEHLRQPQASAHVRVDTGVQAGRRDRRRTTIR